MNETISTGVRSLSGSVPLAGQHAVITGASRGIGVAVAEMLAELGADVTIMGRSESVLRERAADIEKITSRQCQSVVVDVTDEIAVETAFRVAVEGLGDPSILVNNAGIGKGAPFHRETSQQWHELIAVNLNGTFYCTRQVFPAMRKKGYGRIVNVASIAGLAGHSYMAAYCASKHGVVGLTRSLAIEAAKSGITVNALCPGWTDTDMVSTTVDNIVAKTGRAADEARGELAGQNVHGRFVETGEVAEAVAWLCLPTSSSVNGQAIAVSGGPLLS